MAYADVATIKYRIGMADAMTHPSRRVKMAENFLRTISPVIERDRDRINLPREMIDEVLAEAEAFYGEALLDNGDPVKARAHLARSLRLRPWQPRIAEAHGLPMDIWLIPAAGGTPQRLTHLSEDEPAPAWAPDGARMAVMATGGFYVVTVATGEARKLGLGAFGGQADWR